MLRNDQKINKKQYKIQMWYLLFRQIMQHCKKDGWIN